MNFVEISENSKVYPGEYLLYEPTKAVVLCGAFNRKENVIKAYGGGRLIEDKINKFKKIEIKVKEFNKNFKSKCKGCGS